jgi:hypothetical protein
MHNIRGLGRRVWGSPQSYMAIAAIVIITDLYGEMSTIEFGFFFTLTYYDK